MNLLTVDRRSHDSLQEGRHTLLAHTFSTSQKTTFNFFNTRAVGVLALLKARFEGADGRHLTWSVGAKGSSRFRIIHLVKDRIHRIEKQIGHDRRSRQPPAASAATYSRIKTGLARRQSQCFAMHNVL